MGGRALNPAMRRARIEQAVEMQLKGLPQEDIAMLLGVTRMAVTKWTKEAAANGWIEGVRDRLMQQMLPKAVNVYDEILDTSAETLTTKKIVKAQELRLKAARDIAQGLGALRKDVATIASKQQQVVDLDGYYKLREARRTIQAPLTEYLDGESGQEDRQHRLRAPDAQDAGEQDGSGLRGDGQGRGREEVGGGDGAGGDSSGDQGDGGAACGAGDYESAGVDATGDGQE